jgi:hypothetical protein
VLLKEALLIRNFPGSPTGPIAISNLQDRLIGIKSCSQNQRNRHHPFEHFHIDLTERDVRTPFSQNQCQNIQTLGISIKKGTSQKIKQKICHAY